MKKLLPDCNGFAERNLRYMVSFYELYSPRLDLPQSVANFRENAADQNLPQVVAELNIEDLFSIPWGHHRLILDRCKGNVDKAIFFVRKTIQNNWSRAVLMNFLDTDLYDRHVLVNQSCNSVVAFYATFNGGNPPL